MKSQNFWKDAFWVTVFAGYVWTVGQTGEKISIFKNKNRYVWTGPKGDVTRDNSQRRFLTQHSFAMLEQCWKYSKQCRNNVAKLCCAKNRRCKSSLVTIYGDNQVTYESRVYYTKFSFRHARMAPWLIRPSDLRRFVPSFLFIYLFIFIFIFFHDTNRLRHISQQSSLPPRLLSTLSSKYARIVLQTEEICYNTRRIRSLVASSGYTKGIRRQVNQINKEKNHNLLF